MKIQSIDVREVLDSAKKLIAEEKNLSEALKAFLNVLLMVVDIIIQRLSKNNQNSKHIMQISFKDIKALFNRGKGNLPLNRLQMDTVQKKRGKIKKTTKRNLFERFKKYETENLRFMTVDYVPFTNNPDQK